MGGLGGGAALTAIASKSGLADFAAPTRGLLYEKFSGSHFSPNTAAEFTGAYWDNGSIYPISTGGGDRPFGTRLQLSQGSVLKEIEFSFRLAAGAPMSFLFLGFDGQNNYVLPFVTATVATPNDDYFRTVRLEGGPTVIDNSTWAYSLRCVFSWASPTFLGHPPAPVPSQLLWAARVGFHPNEGGD